MTLEEIVNSLKSAGQDYSQLLNNNPKYTAVASNVTKGLENLVPPQFTNTQDAKSQEYSKKIADWALGNGMGMSGMALAIKAFHGSPVNFDKFDYSKIGTGEGAQSYGHGLYFAQHPKVAEEYRQKLADWGSPFTYEWNGKTYAESKDIDPIRHGLQSIFHQGKAKSLKMANSVMNDAINKDPYIMEMGGEDYANKLLSTIKSANKKDIKATQGQIYETSLQWPDAKREASDPLGEHHLLDWDKPLGQQNQSSVSSLINYLKSIGAGGASTKGSEAYKELMFQERMAGNKSNNPAMRNNLEASLASQKLNELGLPGIKYLDQGSRKAGGTSNYVMFGDEYPQITNRAGSLNQLIKK